MKRTSLMRYGTLKSMFMYALPCFCFLRIWSIINLLSVDGEARARYSSKHQSGKCEEARLCSKGAVGVRGCKVAPLVGRVPRESTQPTRSAVLIPPKVFLFADGALCARSSATAATIRISHKSTSTWSSCTLFAATSRCGTCSQHVC